MIVFVYLLRDKIIKMKLVFISVFCVVCLVSCSIGKRAVLSSVVSVEERSPEKYNTRLKSSLIVSRSDVFYPIAERLLNKEESFESVKKNNTLEIDSFNDGFLNTKKSGGLKESIDEVLATKNNKDDDKPTKKKTDVLGLVAVLSILLLRLFPLVIVGTFILGAIAVRKRKKYPNKFKNVFFGTFALVVGLAGCIYGVLVGYVFSVLVLILIFAAAILAGLLILLRPVSAK